MPNFFLQTLSFNIGTFQTRFQKCGPVISSLVSVFCCGFFFLLFFFFFFGWFVVALSTQKTKCISMPFKVFHIMRDIPVYLCKLERNEISHASLEQLQIIKAEIKPEYFEKTILFSSSCSRQHKNISAFHSEEQRHCTRDRFFPDILGLLLQLDYARQNVQGKIL